MNKEDLYLIGTNKKSTFDKHIMWLTLVQMGVSEQTLQIVCHINGFTEETMIAVLYAITGERDFGNYVCPYEPV